MTILHIICLGRLILIDLFRCRLHLESIENVHRRRRDIMSTDHKCTRINSVGSSSGRNIPYCPIRLQARTSPYLGRCSCECKNVCTHCSDASGLLCRWAMAELGKPATQSDITRKYCKRAPKRIIGAFSRSGAIPNLLPNDVA